MLRFLVPTILLTSLACQVQGGELLPGELPVDWGRTLVSPSASPTVADIAEAVARSNPEPLAILRLHADLQNHYCPMFSEDASSLVFLRSDLDAGACKLGVFRNLFDPKATILYDDFFSLDHMPAWGAGKRPLLAFASNNSDDRQENIHIWDLDGPPRQVTSETESNVLPHLTNRQGAVALVYRHQGELRSVKLSGAEFVPETDETLGAGLEARFEPSGSRLAVIREGGVTGSRLLVHDRNTGQETILVPGADRVLRNASWSPDGKSIAYFARPNSSQVWSLEAVAAESGKRHKSLVEGIRVQEDFRHFGPSWGPDSKKLWYVDTDGEAGYYPVRWIDAESGTRGTVELPKELLTASDVHCSRAQDHSAVAFVAVQERALDVYVMILNHP